MPEVPKLYAGQTADPFGSRVQGKDQSRVGRASDIGPSPTDIAIATGIMFEKGTLFPKATDAPKK